MVIIYHYWFMLDQILTILIAYQYWALLLIVFLAALFNIAPASSALIAAGALVALGHLDYSLVFLFGLVGSVVGDLLSYSLAFIYGQDVLIRLGFKRLLKSNKFQQINRVFTAHSTRTIFVSRFFLTSFGPLINLIAGLARSDFKKFIICSLFGQIIYVTLLTGIGYVGARHWQYISNFYGYLALILVIIAVYWLYRRFFRRAVT